MTRRHGMDVLTLILRLTLTGTFAVAGFALTAYGALSISAAPLNSPNAGIFVAIGLWLLLTVACMTVIARSTGVPF